MKFGVCSCCVWLCSAPAQSSSQGVCVWERVVAGSPSCVDVLCLSALVATDGEM